MGRFRLEDFDGQPNPMRWADNSQAELFARTSGLSGYKVCVVEVCGFEFLFHSVVQLELCLDFYRLGARHVPHAPAAALHAETQRWFERLPHDLLEEPRRRQVLAALERAHIEYRQVRSANTGAPKPRLFG